MSTPVSLSLTLPALSDAETVAIAALDFLGGRMGVDAARLGEAKLALTEAVINAIEHAQPEDGEVLVTCSLSAEQLVVLVQDNGRGFDPDVASTPDMDGQVSGSDRRGWGLTLMRSMADDITIDSGPGGTRITTVKNLI